MRKRIIVTFLTLCIPLCLPAQNAAEALGGLCVPRDPVLLSMAGAGSSMTASGPAYAAFGNPAAAALAPTTVEAGVSYAGWSPEYASLNNLAVGVAGRPAESAILTLGMARQGYPAFDPGDGTSFSPSDLLLCAGAGLKVAPALAFGATVNYQKQTLLQDYSLSGVSVSPWVQYHLDALNVAAALSRLGGKVKSGDGSAFSLPSSVKLAADYGFAFSDLCALRLALDGDYYFSGNYAVAAGLNLALADTGFLRAGYRYASPQCVLPSCLSFGAGVRFAGVGLDFAYLTASETLSGTWMAGLSYRF